MHVPAPLLTKLVAGLASALLLTVACGGSAGSGAPGASLDGGASEASTSGAVPPAAGGEPHTPATGCRSGFVTCPARGSTPAICAHVEDDATHCGSCETICQDGSCVAGKCVAGSTVCNFGALCGSQCVKNRGSNIDHCGSCFDRCGDAQLCVGGVCVSGDGNGSSCASPLVWDVYDQENAGFRGGLPQTSTHVFPCGPLSAIPVKWFRFTGTKDNTNVSVDSSNPADSLALAVYTSSACDASVLVGCSVDKVEPSIDVPNAKGKTFFVAVGSVSVAGPAPASIRVDH